jgi:hypothetical protein
MNPGSGSFESADVVSTARAVVSNGSDIGTVRDHRVHEQLTDTLILGKLKEEDAFELGVWCSRNTTDAETKEGETEGLLLKGGRLSFAQRLDDDLFNGLDGEDGLPRYTYDANVLKAAKILKSEVPQMSQFHNGAALLKRELGARLLGLLSSPNTAFLNSPHLTETGLSSITKTKSVAVSSSVSRKYVLN